MTSSLTAAAPRRAITAIALGVAACGGGGDGPTGLTKREVTLYFCGITWAAYRNEGESWTTLPATPQVVVFGATDRLAIATVSRSGGSSPRLDVHYLTAEQAEATFVCGAPGSVPTTKRLFGSVTGLASDATAWISMGPATTYATPNGTAFEVRAPADGTADLVATHEPFSSPTSGRADKVIIRHGETHADGATMPVLDFSSTEAFAPQSSALTVDGFFSGVLTVYGGVRTARGAVLTLAYDIEHGSAVFTTLSVPESRLATGDLHLVSAATSDRSLLHWYQTPADRRVALGPSARIPGFAIPGGTGEVLRLSVASQAEYAEQATVLFTPPQPATSGNTVVLTATKEYFGGTPGTWMLVLPDLRGVSGFMPIWGPAPGGNGWRLTVSSFPHGLSPSSPVDGDIYRTASATGVITIPQ